MFELFDLPDVERRIRAAFSFGVTRGVVQAVLISILLFIAARELLRAGKIFHSLIRAWQNWLDRHPRR